MISFCFLQILNDLWKWKFFLSLIFFKMYSNGLLNFITFILKNKKEIYQT